MMLKKLQLINKESKDLQSDNGPTIEIEKYYKKPMHHDQTKHVKIECFFIELS